MPNSEFVEHIRVLKEDVHSFLTRLESLGQENQLDTSDYNKQKQACLELFFKLVAIPLPPKKEAVVVEVEEPPKRKKRARLTEEERKERRKERRERRNKRLRETFSEVNWGDRKKARRENGKLRKKKDDTGMHEEVARRYHNFLDKWNIDKFTESLENFTRYLVEAKEIFDEGVFLVEYAKSFAPEYLYPGKNREHQRYKDVDIPKIILPKLEVLRQFIRLAEFGKKQIQDIAQLKKIFIEEIFPNVKTSLEDLEDGAVSEAQEWLAAVQKFKLIFEDDENPVLVRGIEELDILAETVQNRLQKLEQSVAILFDETSGTLDDWFNLLKGRYSEFHELIEALIPGVRPKDATILQMKAYGASTQGFIKKAENYLKNATDDVLEDIQRIQGYLAQAKLWAEGIHGFIADATTFFTNLTDGKYVEAYENLEVFVQGLHRGGSLIEGTDVDDKLMKMLSDKMKEGEELLLNSITKSPEDQGTIKDMLNSIHTLILSSGGVVDHSSKYTEDKSAIVVPEMVQLSAKEVEALMEQYDILSINESFSVLLYNIQLKISKKVNKVEAKYHEASLKAFMLSNEFKDAKTEYDKSVEKQRNYVKSINDIGKKVISSLFGLATTALSPAAGAVVKAVGNALLGEFDALNEQIDEIIPEEHGLIRDLTKGFTKEFLPQFGQNGEAIIEADKLFQGLKELYQVGLDARYEDINEMLQDMEHQLSGLVKNLRTLERATVSSQNTQAVKGVKREVLVLAKRWNMLDGQVDEKYLESPYPPIDQKKGYVNCSRYLYATWLIHFPKKEIRIGKTMIKQFKKFRIIGSGTYSCDVEWDTGAWASFSRGFMGFFGGDARDTRAKVQQLKQWAGKERDVLRTMSGWQRSFSI